MKRVLATLGLLLLSSTAQAVVTSTPVGNVAYTILPTDQRVYASVALTANRTWTLPSAGATCIGQTCPPVQLEIADPLGNIGGANSCIVIAPASGEQINGSTNSITFCSTAGRVVLVPYTGTQWSATVYGPGAVQGTTTNDNASAGYVGEFISSFVISGATGGTQTAPALTTTVASGVTSVSLTAGDWDCRGNAEAILGPTTSLTMFSAWTSSASYGAYVDASNVTDFGALAKWWATNAIYPPSNRLALTLAPTRYSLAATTTIWMGAQANFTTAALNVAGYLGCRRVR